MLSCILGLAALRRPLTHTPPTHQLNAFWLALQEFNLFSFTSELPRSEEVTKGKNVHRILHAVTEWTCVQRLSFCMRWSLQHWYKKKNTNVWMSASEPWFLPIFAKRQSGCQKLQWFTKLGAKLRGHCYPELNLLSWSFRSQWPASIFDRRRSLIMFWEI